MSVKSASVNQIKNRKKLLSGKFRKKEGLFLAEGIRCVEQILENRVIEVIELFIEDGFDGDHFINYNIPIFTLNGKDFASLSDTDTPQGIIAICKIPVESDPSVLSEKPGLFVAFDEIQDPGNLGTMIRTASWFGAAGILIGNGTVDLFHPKVVRSTAGATGTLPYIKSDLTEVFEQMEKAGKKVYLLDGSENSLNLKTIKPDKNAVLTVGNEANGIHSNLFTAERIAIKIHGSNHHVESLNAAVALSIGLYQFFSD